MYKALLTALVVGTVVTGSTIVEANADAYDRHITLINLSHRTIVEFHASNVGTDSWEEDILGDSVLRPGGSVRMDLNDDTGYCRFDFKTVAEDGQAVVRRSVNVCEASTYTIAD
jgi:hypothetical protein